MKFTFSNDKKLFKSEYTNLFQNGQRYVGRFWVIRYCFVEPGYSKLGLAMSKKNVKTAVKRHQCKRVVRESFRIQQYNHAIHLVVMPRKYTQKANKAELRICLEQFWQSLKQPLNI